MLVVIYTFTWMKFWEEDKWVLFYCFCFGRFFSPLIFNFLVLIYLWTNSYGHNEKRKFDSSLILSKTKMVWVFGREKYSSYSLKERRRFPFWGSLFSESIPLKTNVPLVPLNPTPYSSCSFKLCKHFIKTLF